MAAAISSIPRLQSPTLTPDWDVDGISTLSRRDLTLPGNNNGHIPKICEKYPRTLQDIIDVTNRVLRYRTSPQNHNHDQNLDDGCQNIRSSFSKGLLSNTVRIDERKSVESPPLRQAANPHAGVFRYDDNPPRELRTYTGKYEVLGTYADNVHRKSNEQIRPALRHHRSLGTLPLYKSVHFDAALENILYFHEMDRPFDVKKDTSPVTDCDETDLFPPPYKSLKKRALPYEWELITPEFPHDTTARETMPVRLERVSLSNDQMAILGSVIVANLAFEKSVVCRFTLDFWNTIWETTAKYDYKTNPGEIPGYDRFVFSIMLADTVDFEAQPLFLCIRYAVNGQEYWDNNSGTNFQVDVIKRYLCWVNKG
ncbi:hypothetical protein FOXG_19589 [Fusarium oxysporum f. sp. lycopersici 4287]|uniref:CBM21 domain-containing protein n=1 Tax=Fusarium oxysporum f. sp. lycopersici (strain 4287 / CBS 123668 / FGSC 9935 / NRRL 34936) TaxID=426428 RepID=A0A0J9V4U1_FUSO4|nr:hypothetical protein FOXG_19589 [Fusarium oxysporum f. sp. lycopersici 4287]KAJ9419762.1 putative phosphatase regulatory subunit-domain-containing protein [Fusarium oxysporum]KNB06168.1 hypothetical protein FOXG_19589 [Fusarium oxysporum f. sp. lycopersici 4287]